jgi:glycosyltransferase involved in cell wall biosynthesis
MNAAWEGSYAKTGLLAYYLRRFQKQGRLDSVTRWIAVSDFMRSKFIDAGIPAKRIFTLRHCWQPVAPIRPVLEGDYYLFLGRLVNEKGLQTLLEAWTLLEDELGPRCPRLIIGGTGPEEARVRGIALASRRITCAGFVASDEKAELLAHCRGVIVPSIWWEPLGLIVYEAYDHQRPVLAAMAGGLIETVQHGKTGYLHEPGAAECLANDVERMEAIGRDGRAAMGIAARQWLELSASPAVWRKELHRLLSEIIPSPAK